MSKQRSVQLTSPAGNESICSNNSGGNGCVHQFRLLPLSRPSRSWDAPKARRDRQDLKDLRDRKGRKVSKALPGLRVRRATKVVPGRRARKAQKANKVLQVLKVLRGPLVQQAHPAPLQQAFMR